jgi:hypothetical protein
MVEISTDQISAPIFFVFLARLNGLGLIIKLN